MLSRSNGTRQMQQDILSWKFPSVQPINHIPLKQDILSQETKYSHIVPSQNRMEQDIISRSYATRHIVSRSNETRHTFVNVSPGEAQAFKTYYRDRMEQDILSRSNETRLTFVNEAFKTYFRHRMKQDMKQDILSWTKLSKHTFTIVWNKPSYGTRHTFSPKAFKTYFRDRMEQDILSRSNETRHTFVNEAFKTYFRHRMKQDILSAQKLLRLTFAIAWNKTYFRDRIETWHTFGVGYGILAARNKADIPPLFRFWGRCTAIPSPSGSGSRPQGVPDIPLSVQPVKQAEVGTGGTLEPHM
jgi:hypothetical protein